MPRESRHSLFTRAKASFRHQAEPLALPLAVRKPESFSPENLQCVKYLLFVDWPRRAEMLGLPHAWPSPDPIVQDLATFTIANPESYRIEVERNQQDLEAAGHWGVPTFVFRGEPFFGQDRIDTLCWRLDREGLAVWFTPVSAPGRKRKLTGASAIHESGSALGMRIQSVDATSKL